MLVLKYFFDPIGMAGKLHQLKISVGSIKHKVT